MHEMICQEVPSEDNRQVGEYMLMCTYTPRGVSKTQLFLPAHQRDKLDTWEAVPMKAQPLLGILALTLLLTKLELGESVAVSTHSWY